eukprot:TRINITY_DN19340_c0_g1::TRINITY_DN19340_c0_g1_i1::g.7870::m.7870 TRINITY_DN19340_c0_g1::TRINITY_DN19340_c0_g1_i1::g.7870  ORF type:complete len:315 (+),score=67.07,GST_C_3/PF14497.1/0.095 TRINITY_DN19340_c0_g1_i1:58-945(+)
MSIQFTAANHSLTALFPVLTKYVAANIAKLGSKVEASVGCEGKTVFTTTFELSNTGIHNLICGITSALAKHRELLQSTLTLSLPGALPAKVQCRTADAFLIENSNPSVSYEFLSKLVKENAPKFEAGAALEYTVRDGSQTLFTTSIPNNSDTLRDLHSRLAGFCSHAIFSSDCNPVLSVGLPGQAAPSTPAPSTPAPAAQGEKKASCVASTPSKSGIKTPEPVSVDVIKLEAQLGTHAFFGGAFPNNFDYAVFGSLLTTKIDHKRHAKLAAWFDKLKSFPRRVAGSTVSVTVHIA